MNVNCIVLAGGKSSRMGRDKVIAQLPQGQLLEQVLGQLDFAHRCIIVTGEEAKHLPRVSAGAGIEIIPDAWPELGPLGGIYSGLKVSDTNLNVVVAGDMPFLSRDLLVYMLTLAEGYDAVVPRLGDKVEPLHAVYAMSSLAPIETKLKEGRLGVHRMFDFLNTRYVARGEIERHDPARRSFFNINTESDLEAARKILREIET